MPESKIIRENESEIKEYFPSVIFVSIMNDDGAGSVTSSFNADYAERYNEFFYSDSREYKPLYDGSNVCLGYNITIDYGYDGRMEEIGVLKNGKAELDDPEERPEYVFGGWFVDDNGYNFDKPVTKSFTITAKWLKDGENAVSITPDKVYVMSTVESKLYVSAYKNGKLTGVALVDAKTGFSWKLAEIGLDTSGADKLAAFLWDSRLTPLCGNADTVLK